eukprot:RCo004076
MSVKNFPAIKDEIHPSRREPAPLPHGVRAEFRHEWDVDLTQRKSKRISIDARAFSREKRSLRAAAGEFPLRGAVEVPSSPLSVLCSSAQAEKWFSDDNEISPMEALEKRMSYTSEGLSTLYAIFNAMRSKARPFAESQAKCNEFVRLAEQVIKNHMEAFSALNAVRPAWLLGSDVARQAPARICGACGGELPSPASEAVTSGVGNSEGSTQNGAVASASASSPPPPQPCPHCGHVPNVHVATEYSSLASSGVLLAKRRRYATPPVTSYVCTSSLPPVMSSSVPALVKSEQGPIRSGAASGKSSQGLAFSLPADGVAPVIRGVSAQSEQARRHHHGPAPEEDNGSARGAGGETVAKSSGKPLGPGVPTTSASASADSSGVELTPSPPTPRHAIPQ